MNSMGLIDGLSVLMKVSCVHPPTIRKCSCSGLRQEVRGKEEWRASPRSTNILRCYFKLFYIRSWGSTGNYLFIFFKKSMPLKGHFHSRTPNLRALTPALTSTYAHACAPPDPLLLKIHIQYLRAHVYFKRHNFPSIYTHCPLLKLEKKTADPVLLWEVLGWI